MRRSTALFSLGLSLAAAAPTAAVAGRLERVLSQSGALDKRDMTLANGELAEVFPVELQVGDRVLAELESRKFNTYLVLKSPAGQTLENDDLEGDQHLSQVEFIVEESGTWLVYATSALAGERGKYSLTVSVDRSGRGAATVQALTPGSPVAGVLQDGDMALPDGEWVDAYTLDVQAGQHLVVDLSADQLDTYLVVQAPSGETEDSDDFDGSPSHSRVDRVAEESGQWLVYATTYGAGQGGSYTLLAQLEAPGAAPSGVQRWSGELAEGDAVLDSGELLDTLSVQGVAGERWVVDLRSTAFDPFLVIKGPDGEQLENDDFEGASDRSLLDLTLGMDGAYTLAVTTYQAGEHGAYDLTLRRVSDDEQDGDGLSQSGTLAQGDAVLGGGEWYDTYSFEGLPGQQVVVDMRGTFDTYMALTGPGGFQQENDDGAETYTSQIAAVLPEAGTYQIVATAYGAGQGGDYTVDLHLTEPSAGAAEQRDVGVLEAGAGVVGVLEAGDMTLDSGEYQDLYVIEVQAGQALAVSMTSSDFDTYIALGLPDGSIVENDDWEGHGDQSRIEITAPQSGRYRVLATSYRSGETGDYRLDTTVGDGALTAAVPAAIQGQTRTFGVFMGISDYPSDGPGDLQYTADDARQLYAGLQATGMSADDGRLLVDSDATRANFRAAVDEFAGQMDENDRLIIFYSGHGGRVDHEGFQAADPDGYDETLALYDGQITDDEVAALLDDVQEGTVLLVLDSCFSGGFSKDAISRPNRMGLFSSQEDVTSAVAQKFRAGGYLSRFMIEAVGQRLADVDGDGALTALELSQYLYERYRADVKSAPQDKSGAYSDIVMTGQNLGYQQLIVDRGGVGPSQVLFAW